MEKFKRIFNAIFPGQLTAIELVTGVGLRAESVHLVATDLELPTISGMLDFNCLRLCQPLEPPETPINLQVNKISTYLRAMQLCFS